MNNCNEMIKRKEVIIGGTGKGTGNSVNGAILRNLFGVNVQQVLGFPGSAEQSLAIERGEITPSMKVKRNVVEDNNQALLDSFYA